MFGFSIVLINESFPFELPHGYVKQLNGKVWVKHTTNGVFEHLKLLKEVNNELIGFDGVVFNEAKLLKANQCNSSEELVRLWSSGKLPDNEIKGEFAGFVLNAKGELIVKANPNGTKPWFFGRSKFGVIVSNSLKDITAFLKICEEDIKVNKKAAIELLSYGFLIGNKTTFEQVYKLRAGEQLKATQLSIQVYKSERHNSITYNNNSLQKNAELLNELLTENIYDSYSFNLANGKPQVATLSGGLDARLNVLLAKKMGFAVDETYSMGQSGHADLTIPNKISQFVGSNQYHYLLDDATHLKKLKANIVLNEGLVIYSGSAHLLAMLGNAKTSFGLIQSGQMGNVIGGGNVSKAREVKPNLIGKAYNSKHVHFTENWVQAELNAWKNEEVAKINERVFNGVNNGSWICENYGYYTSPFLQANVIEFILSVPPSQKINYKLYMEFIANHLPSMKQWAWDRTGIPPYGKWSLEYGKWRNRILKIWEQKIVKQTQKASMNPYEYWAKKHTWLIDFIVRQWNDNKEVIAPYADVWQIATDVMENGSLLEKTQVITLVYGLNYHLNE